MKDLLSLVIVVSLFLAALSRESDATTTSITTTNPGLVTTRSILDDIARYITNDGQATFDSTSSASFEELFACFGSTDGTDNVLLHSQNGAWSGLTQYANAYSNAIILRNPTNGQDVTTIDEWGGRCFPSPTNPGTLECDDPNPTIGWSECPEEDTCEPEIMAVSLSDDTVLDMEIYEPCNMVSNLAYYRTIPEICAANLFADGSATGTSPGAVALAHAMAGLAFSSAFFHGSNTYLGGVADTRMIDVVALIDYQVLIGALIDANPGIDQGQADRLFHLQDTPRSKTAAETALEVTDLFNQVDVSEWAQRIRDLDVPEYRASFTVLVATALSIIFPTRDEMVQDITLALINLLGGEADTLEYLPTIQLMTNNLGLSPNERFVLLRQFMGTLFKLLYAFLWQEVVLPIPIFLEEGPNQIGADIMPTLMSLFNFISGFDHQDTEFQNADSVYPGDDTCRLQPHAKWHEVSANGLLDLAFTVDCIRSAVSGNGFNCATLSGISGMDSISLDDVRTWTYAAFPSSSSNFFLGATFEIAVLAVWLPLDRNFDGQIDYIDIEHIIEDVTDWIQFVEDAFDWWNGFMTDLNTVADTANCILDPVCIGDTVGACLTDDMCPGAEQCVFLSCGLQGTGDPCLFDSDCATGSCGLFTCGLQGNGAPCVLESDCSSGRCEWDTFTCEPKLGLGATCNEDNDCISGVCTGGHGFIQGVCGKQPDGSPCIEDEDCQSGRCEGYIWEQSTCYPRQPNGGDCNEDTDCQSGRCEGWWGFSTCRAKVGRGSSCNEGSDCLSGRCNTNWWGSGSCA